MKTKSTILAIAATAGLAAASPSHAQGISFDGGYVQGEYISSSTAGAFDYSQSGIYGAVQASYGNFAVQADLGSFGYDYSSEDSTYYAVHAMYNFSPKLVLGGYYGQDLWGGGGVDYATYGLEAKFTPGFLDSRLTFEAFAGIYLNQLNDFDNKMIGLGVDYRVNDSINLGASYLRGAWTDLNDPADQYDVLEIEGTYHMASGLYATVSYTDTIFQGSTGEEATFGIAIGYSFGQGVTFDRRGYTDLYPGD